MGLFFASFEYAKPENDNSLNDYISLYFIDNTIDWMQASIQTINVSGIKQIETMLSDLDAEVRSRVGVSDVLNDTKNLTYCNYVNIGFLVVDGPQNGISKKIHLSWIPNVIITLPIQELFSKKGSLF